MLLQKQFIYLFFFLYNFTYTTKSHIVIQCAVCGRKGGKISEILMGSFFCNYR